MIDRENILIILPFITLLFIGLVMVTSSSVYVAENAIERAVVLAEELEISEELLAIDDEERPMSIRKPELQNPQGAPEPIEELSLEDYFQRFVIEHQDAMNETQLAKKLGISRKCLWERRQRFGIPRKKKH